MKTAKVIILLIAVVITTSAACGVPVDGCVVALTFGSLLFALFVPNE